MKPTLSWILALWSLTSGLAAAEMSLVPATPSTVPDYFCTWGIQGRGHPNDPNAQADAMTETNLFGTGPGQNWVEFYPEIRGDLFLVLDDTWDIPIGIRVGGGKGHPLRGSMELDAGRFPSCQGTPAERLARLNREVRAHGWRGVGLWVYSGRARDRQDSRVNEEQYWAERMGWCREAGINYWKVDWGTMGVMEIWRLNQWSHRYNPALWIEHGGLERSGARMWLPDKIDIFRTYDVNSSVAIPETIRRIGQVLRYPREDNTSLGLINCEDEPYIGAAMGCVYGIMRHPLSRRLALDEVTRAVRWHRIAQPFGPTEREAIDTNLVKETANGGGAPARIARGGLSLPTVIPAEGNEPPYVLCSRYPDGEIAVATIGRRQGDTVTFPRADVTLAVGELNRPVGIFGEYNTLTLLTTSVLSGKRILAQDLAGQVPVEISSEVKVSPGRLTIPGAVIQRVGLMAARPGDGSGPGLVLGVEGLTRFVAKAPMKPFAGQPPKLPAGEPGAGLKIVRALWGPVFGGEDVTAAVAGLVKEGALRVEAYPEEFGKSNPSLYQRLEVEYTCKGQGHLALANYGERLVIDAQGQYRTERAPRKETDALAELARQGKVSVSKYNEKKGSRMLTIRKAEALTELVITSDRGARLLAVLGPASLISETEYAVTGFSRSSNMEERLEVKSCEDGSLQLRRASLPFPETMTFLKAPEDRPLTN